MGDLGPNLETLIIFVHNKRKAAVELPLPMPNIARVSSRNVLGVTFTNSLSVSEHVHTVIGACVQTFYVSRILRAHGMDDTSLQTLYYYRLVR